MNTKPNFVVVAALDFSLLGDRALEEAATLHDSHNPMALHVIVVGQAEGETVRLPTLDMGALPGADADDFTCRVEEKYQSLAVEVGLVPPGAPLTREHLDFAYGVASLCAVVVDRFRDSRDGSAGDHIRANYGPVPF